MNNKMLVILGAGGHAKVCYDIARKMNKWNEIIMLDDNQENDYFEIRGQLSDIHEYPSADFFVAIGDNKIRKKLINNLQNKKYHIVSLIDPSANISETVNIKRGTVIMPGVVINANTRIGLGCILNTSCSVDHDNNIGDYVHISPGVNIAGNVSIGSLSWVGIGATIINNVDIDCEVVIGAGAVVVKRIENQGIYVGVPAKKIEE